MTRLASAAAIAAALLCAGCTAPAVTGGSTPTMGSTGMTSSAVEAPAVDPTSRTSGTLAPTSATSTVPGVGESDRPVDTTAVTAGLSSTPLTASTPPSTSTPEAPSLPGGTAGRLEMQKNGWLDPSGRVVLTRTTAEEISDVGATASLCTYLFGSLDKVVALAMLPDGSTLDPMSGPQLTDDALLVACVYDVADTPALVLQVGVGPEIDPDLPGRPTIVAADDVQAVFSYAPGRTGLATAVAEQWLRQAAARIIVTP